MIVAGKVNFLAFWNVDIYGLVGQKILVLSIGMPFGITAFGFLKAQGMQAYAIG